MRTLTVRLDDDQSALVESLKKEFGQSTSSKALLFAGSEFLVMKSHCEKLNGENQAQSLEIDRLNKLIDEARASALAFYEDLAQGDLLSS